MNAFREFHSLKFLYIKQCGLTEVPSVISNGRKNEIIDIVDFESNKLTILKSYSINIKAGEVLFDNNLIESVEDFAFNGSLIAKLSFKGNIKLTHLADGCFNGIQHLQQLDLSETSITKLPTSGLKNLETLKLINTPTLKVIPSVYNFNKIKRAQLTYPHHCCAFKFPSTHDQTAEYKLLIEKHIQECELKKKVKIENEKKKKLHSTSSLKKKNEHSNVNLNVNTATTTVASTLDHNHLNHLPSDSIRGNSNLTKILSTGEWIVGWLPSWTENLIGKLLGQRNMFRVSRLFQFVLSTLALLPSAIASSGSELIFGLTFRGTKCPIVTFPYGELLDTLERKGKSIDGISKLFTLTPFVDVE